jgi:ABC-type antimicrobial peptide transport system permease subunit
MFFLPLAQWADYREDMMRQFEVGSHFIDSTQLRLRGDGRNIEGRMRKVLADIDPNLTVLRVDAMRQQVDANFDQERTVAQMAGLLALLALVLAAVGLYGVTAYAVAVRTGEIGVRMALGAKPADIVRSVLGNAFFQIAIGLALGVPIAIGAGRLMSSELYQVSSYDPLVLTVAILALAFCALLESIIPAQRAATIDPVQAMRTE